jgi:DNA modification methylase
VKSSRIGSSRIYYHSSEKMGEIRDGSAALVLASPPFTNRKDGKTLSKAQYLEFLHQVFCEAFRILRTNGVLVTVNTDLRDHARYNGGDTQFDGLLWQKHCAIRGVAETAGFRSVDTKIWAKSLNRNVYRYNFAYIQVLSRGRLKTPRRTNGKAASAFGADVWLLEGGTQRRDARGKVFRDAIHPEIARRCIARFTKPEDLVVSPFVGSGTILSVAKMMGRGGVGYEINADLKELIEESIKSPGHFAAYAT